MKSRIVIAISLNCRAREKVGAERAEVSAKVRAIKRQLNIASRRSVRLFTRDTSRDRTVILD